MWRNQGCIEDGIPPLRWEDCSSPGGGDRDHHDHDPSGGDCDHHDHSGGDYDHHDHDPSGGDRDHHDHDDIQ